MAEITIQDSALQNLKDKVVIVTGGSSGIGLATTNHLISLGSKVINGDISPPSTDPSHSLHHFHPTDVTSWTSLNSLFKTALQLHGHIDHVFANAGIGPRADYLNLGTDDAGEPLEPDFTVLDVNLRGVINTASLAAFYMQKQDGIQGSIVLCASSSCFSRFRAADYAIAKHGVLGLLRGLTPSTHPNLPIRVNALAPSWTISNMVTEALYANSGATLQESSAPARAAIYLMADTSRHGQMVLSVGDEYKEIEEAVLLKGMSKEVRGQEKDEDEILVGVLRNMLA